ncbi:DivIVA domain-containing protein [Pseudokineococcus sp. 5B2Z-1]|uniref:DivIVA domain-containing protein n=1 Tax=Pseudokineococcus sp. 5B2Z-1 TaxID=3132744 RepID=UPI0030A4D985
MSTPITAAELRGTALRTTRFSAGYDVEEVDAFLDRAAAALEGAVVLAPDDVHAVLFTQSWRRGYAVDEVDDLLDRVADALRPAPALGRHARTDAVDPRAGAGTATGGRGHRPTAADLRAVALPGAPLLRRGYARDEVDALLERAADALERRGADRPRLSAEEVTEAVFRTRRRGYDQGAVDALLDDVVAALAAAGRGEHRTG